MLGSELSVFEQQGAETGLLKMPVGG